jgi:hypothetical protein
MAFLTAPLRMVAVGGATDAPMEPAPSQSAAGEPGQTAREGGSCGRFTIMCSAQTALWRAAHDPILPSIRPFVVTAGTGKSTAGAASAAGAATSSDSSAKKQPHGKKRRKAGSSAATSGDEDERPSKRVHGELLDGPGEYGPLAWCSVY